MIKCKQSKTLLGVEGDGGGLQLDLESRLRGSDRGCGSNTLISNL